MKTKLTFKAALDAYIADHHPTIVKRELVANGRIRATDSEGMIYLSLDTKAVLPGSFQDEKTKKYFAPISNELQTTDMLNANRDMATFNATYRNGLAEEKRVIEFLRTKFENVINSTKRQNIDLDIDCFIDGVSVSIKAEHDGCKYRNIYFELENQLTATQEWHDDGWFYTGEAEKYVIIQGNTIRMYSKAAIKDYVAANGWLRVLGLSAKRKASQGGSYRTMDTRCGYLDNRLVPFEQEWKVS